MRITTVTRPRRAAAGIGALLAGVVLLGAGPPAALTTPAAVDLGSAARFAVLAGGGITDTGPSVISGDVGTHPLPAVSDLLDQEASGTVDRAGAESQQAQRDLAVAFASVAAIPRDGTVSLTADRAIPPGAYTVADASQGLAANLTLDGQDQPDPVWIFVVSNDLATVPGSTITLVNGAQACNVFWLVGGAATLASRSTFAGSLLAMTSVTVGGSATIAGRLLARSATVSLGGDRITLPVCSSSSTARSAPQLTSAGALSDSSGTPDAAAGSELPAYLPLLMLVLFVAAVLLGEPRHRHDGATRRGW
jgi:hypothetical protein